MKKLDGRFVKQCNGRIDVSKLIQLRVFPRFACNVKLSTEELFLCVSHQRKDLGFHGGLDVKNPPAVQDTQVRSLGWEDCLEKGMATNSSVLA